MLWQVTLHIIQQILLDGISTENWNNYNNNTAHPLVNKAVQNSYSPGSTFKMVTAIAGLESGVIDLNTKINDTGVYMKYASAGFRPRCWYYTDYHRGHGWLDVSGAIEKSCNYFFYETADRMGIDALAKMARYFGLGSKTGIELPSEASGSVASKETKARLHANSDPNWYAADTLQAAIGQNDNSFSPVQMARYISILANGGNRVQPTIVKTVRNADGSEVSKNDIESFVNQKLGIEQEQVEDIDINQEYLDAVLVLVVKLVLLRWTMVTRLMLGLLGLLLLRTQRLQLWLLLKTVDTEIILLKL